MLNLTATDVPLPTCQASTRRNTCDISNSLSHASPSIFASAPVHAFSHVLIHWHGFHSQFCNPSGLRWWWLVVAHTACATWVFRLHAKLPSTSCVTTLIPVIRRRGRTQSMCGRCFVQESNSAFTDLLVMPLTRGESALRCSIGFRDPQALGSMLGGHVRRSK